MFFVRELVKPHYHLITELISWEHIYVTLEKVDLLRYTDKTLTFKMHTNTLRLLYYFTTLTSRHVEPEVDRAIYACSSCRAGL